MFEGCTRGAEGSTPFCKGHGGGKRCLFEGGGVCPKSVHGGTSFCVAHGGGKRCNVPGCTKSARGRSDCCVKHGGGKRCKFDECNKSAQGSTDFCKAHGGGKRCAWDTGCDKFARGRSGLCAAHATQMASKLELEPEQGRSMAGPGLFSGIVSDSSAAGSSMDHGISSSGHATWSDCIDSSGDMPSGGRLLIPHQVLVPGSLNAPSSYSLAGNAREDGGSQSQSFGLVVPEGRVHGGGLMSMLRVGGNLGSYPDAPKANNIHATQLLSDWRATVRTPGHRRRRTVPLNPLPRGALLPQRLRTLVLPPLPTHSRKHRPRRRRRPRRELGFGSGEAAARAPRPGVRVRPGSEAALPAAGRLDPRPAYWSVLYWSGHPSKGIVWFAAWSAVNPLTAFFSDPTMFVFGTNCASICAMEEIQKDMQSPDSSGSEPELMVTDGNGAGQSHNMDEGSIDSPIDVDGGQSSMDVDVKGKSSLDYDVNGKSSSEPSYSNVPIDMSVESLERFCKQAARSFFDEIGLISHQINSYNDFVSHGIQELFDSLGDVVVEPGYDPSKKGSGGWKHAIIKFGRVKLEKPVFWSGKDEVDIDFKPRHARISSDREAFDVIDIQDCDASVINTISATIKESDDLCEGFRKSDKARRYVDELVKNSRFPPTESFDDYVDRFLFPDISGNRNKALFLGYMVKCLLMAFTGRRKCDNKDDFRNKRLELPGELLGRELRAHIRLAERRMVKAIQRDLNSDRELQDLERYLDASIVTNGLNRAFSTGSWCHPYKRTERCSGIVATLRRTNPLQMIADLRKTRQRVAYAGKAGDARYPNPSYWGKLCFMSTPDGENCGLVKNLAVTATVSSRVHETQQSDRSTGFYKDQSS
nr:unnamed protein product [Digitaria exilis]